MCFVLFRSELSAAGKKILKEELEMCQQLIEMEPNSKCKLLILMIFFF